ncbi:MAG: RHS repeat-associated core domain-containing protein, partial [Polyangiaceae bacterium]|nr:RHS repeat-associated core domain-containing protein [Polyangiaceae bacterium]
MKTETSAAGTKTYGYDALGNVNQETWSLLKIGADPTDPASFVSETLGFQYDAFGRLLQMVYPGPAAETVSYGYDSGGQLDTVTGVTQNGQSTPYVQHIGYDEFGQKEVFVSGNGIRTTYGYEPVNRRLTQLNASERDPVLAQTGAPARPFQQMSYSYDAVGNITQIRNDAPFDPTLTGPVQVGPVVENFTYDDLYQLESVDGIAQTGSASQAHFGLTMSYDAIGNIVSKQQQNAVDTLSGTTVTSSAIQDNGTYTSAYSYKGPRPHAPTEVDDTVPADVSSTTVNGSFTYDPSGNQGGWTRTSSKGTTTRELTFDEENRLTQVTQNGIELQSSLYDGAGQRTAKRANDSTQTAYFGPYMTVRDGTVVTKHIFAGDERVATKIVPNLADEQCSNCTDSPSVLYFHSDHLGSTSFVSDATQALVSRQEYFPSGEQWLDMDNPTQGIPPTYLFNGKELDTETGLYYYGARYYDPRVQVWVSPDPILAQYMRGKPNGGVITPANLDLYTYAWNNPVSTPDSNGECPWCGTAIGAVAGGVYSGVAYAFTAPRGQTWGQFFVGAGNAVGGGVVYGAVVGTIATVNPQAAFVFIGATQVKDEKDLWKLGLAAPLVTGSSSGTAPQGYPTPHQADPIPQTDPPSTPNTPISLPAFS